MLAPRLGLNWNVYAFAIPSLIGALVMLLVPDPRPKKPWQAGGHHYRCAFDVTDRRLLWAPPTSP